MYFLSKDSTSLKTLIIIWLIPFFCWLRQIFLPLKISCWLSNNSSYSYQCLLFDDTDEFLNQMFFCWRFFLLESLKIIFSLSSAVLPAFEPSIKGNKKWSSFLVEGYMNFFLKKKEQGEFFLIEGQIFFFWVDLKQDKNSYFSINFWYIQL